MQPAVFPDNTFSTKQAHYTAEAEVRGLSRPPPTTGPTTNPIILSSFEMRTCAEMWLSDGRVRQKRGYRKRNGEREIESGVGGEEGED